MKKVCLVLVVVMLAFAFTAVCSAAEKEKMVFGMTVYDVSMPYAAAGVHAAKEKAKELGIEMKFINTTWDPMKQLDAIDNFITMGMDAYISGSTIDPQATIPGYKKLNKLGIPISAIDNSPEGGYIDFYISFDKEGSSAKSTELFVETLKKRHGGKVPSGVVIEVMGDTHTEFAMSCTKGIHSVIDNYTQLKVVQGSGNWNNDEAFKVVSDFLTRFGDDVVGVLVHTPDIMGIGAANAIKKAGRNPADYAMTGICIGPEGIDLLKKGEFTGIVEQPIMISGEMAVEYLYKKIKGQPVPQIGDTIVQDGALWSPAIVKQNPYCDGGAYILLSAPLIPQEASPDDPRLWENRMKGVK